MQTELIIYQFSREKIVQGDFAHFLSLYAPNKLPTGEVLKTMMGRMMFCVHGYDADEREVYLVPEIRAFYRRFHGAWPYWLYFCDLNQDGLTSMALCCLDSLTALKVDGHAKCRVEYDPLELVHFIAADFPYMNCMCESARMSETEIFHRTRDVFMYFNFPFDAASPSD